MLARTLTEKALLLVFSNDSCNVANGHFETSYHIEFRCLAPTPGFERLEGTDFYHQAISAKIWIRYKTKKGMGVTRLLKVKRGRGGGVTST